MSEPTLHTIYVLRYAERQHHFYGVGLDSLGGHAVVIGGPP